MKKLILLCLILPFIICSCSMNSLPEGSLLASYPSPDDSYVLNIYLVNGGATTDYAIRGELKYGESSKNIYWDYHIDHADVAWIDTQTVCINGHVLNVRKDIYDFRKDT